MCAYTHPPFACTCAHSCTHTLSYMHACVCVHAYTCTHPHTPACTHVYCYVTIPASIIVVCLWKAHMCALSYYLSTISLCTYGYTCLRTCPTYTPTCTPCLLYLCAPSQQYTAHVCTMHVFDLVHTTACTSIHAPPCRRNPFVTKCTEQGRYV